MGTTIVLVLCLLSIAQPLLAGTISGYVKDDNGKPQPGSKIIYHTKSERMPGRLLGQLIPYGKRTAGTVVTDEDGRFSIGGLSADTYYLCAQAVKVTQLSNCAWGKTEAVTIDADQAVTNIGFQLRTGTVVTINIADPKSEIVDLADLPVVNGIMPLTGANFNLGTFSGIAFTPAVLLSKSATSRTYQATVPTGTPIRLFVNSELDIVDENGASLPNDRPGKLISTGSTGAISIALAAQ